jgi:hypothetical protein
MTSQGTNHGRFVLVENIRASNEMGDANGFFAVFDKLTAQLRIQCTDNSSFLLHMDCTDMIRACGGEGGDRSAIPAVDAVQYHSPAGAPAGVPAGAPAGAPAEDPGQQSVAQIGQQPVEQPGQQHPDGRSGQRPAEHSAEHAAEHSAEQPDGQPDGQPGAQPDGQPDGQPAGQPAGQPDGPPDGQPGGPPAGRPGGQPDGQPVHTMDVVAGDSMVLRSRPRKRPRTTSISVTVRFLAGGSQLVSICRHSLVLDLKKALQQMEHAPRKNLGLHPDQQKLVFDGTLLQNEDALSHYGVQDGSVIHMCIQFTGRTR